MAYELESAKIQANEEIRKHKKNTLQLFNLLQIACQERNVCRGRESELNSNVSSEIIVFAFRNVTAFIRFEPHLSFSRFGKSLSEASKLMKENCCFVKWINVEVFVVGRLFTQWAA
ncbi:hypothetical protein Droror1_Dr00004015 [Drosera rotundifolia]